MPEEHHGGSGHQHRPFVFLHIGDLHLTDLAAGAEPNLLRRQDRQRQDLREILADIGSLDAERSFDFVYLPGDIAENGCAGEYDVLRAMLRDHPNMPLWLIPGDHDRQLGSMADFARFRAQLHGVQKQPDPVERLVERPFEHRCPPPSAPPVEPVEQHYFRKDYETVRCLFVDTVSAGYGQKGVGVDFRLGPRQAKWLKKKIAECPADKTCAVFIHCYPSDFREKDECAALAGLFWTGNVRLVEMGHTHYNELVHDGRTLYAAARNVGQNEDGPPGYAVAAIDGGVTSWRWKQLQQTWPFVMITSPADRRLATDGLSFKHQDTIEVRALVLTDREPDAVTCFCRVDHGPPKKMHHVPGTTVFKADVHWPPGSTILAVEASDGRVDGKDFVDVDIIEPVGADWQPPRPPAKPGHPDDSIGAWPLKGLRGDRLGPNDRGRKW